MAPRGSSVGDMIPPAVEDNVENAAHALRLLQSPNNNRISKDVDEIVVDENNNNNNLDIDNDTGHAAASGSVGRPRRRGRPSKTRTEPSRRSVRSLSRSAGVGDVDRHDHNEENAPVAEEEDDSNPNGETEDANEIEEPLQEVDPSPDANMQSRRRGRRFANAQPSTNQTRSSKRRRRGHDNDDQEHKEDVEVGNESQQDPHEVEMEGQDKPEQNEERDQAVSARIPAEPPRIVNPSGRPPEAGIITQVYVENFMCHRKLTVDLCRNVNFIHGQNGSGKSAILAAIQICLGAGARQTHRARNLKDLVRRDAGASQQAAAAKVRVTLMNGGEEPYKPDQFGNTITVERTISLKSGGFNGYKLLDSEHKEVCRGKKDVEEMVDYFNIQIENPVAILDQEEAKKFLTGKPGDKYQFFLKATELERVERTFSSTVDRVQELQDQHYRCQDLLQPVQEQCELLRKKWEQHQQLDKLKSKLSNLYVQQAWAFFHEGKSELGKAEQDMKAFAEKAARKQEEYAQAEEAVQNPEVEEEARKERNKRLFQEAQDQANLKQQLENELKEAMAPARSLERQSAQLRTEIDHEKRRLTAAKHRLQKARQEIMAMADSAESDAARRTEQLQSAEEELSRCREQVATLKQAVTSALRSYETLEPQVYDARSKVESLRRQINGAQGTLQQLQSSAHNSLALFGSRVTRVHDMINQSRQKNQFRGPVIGPIGAFIKVVEGKEELASIAEVAFGSGNLDRFIVTNDHDRKILQGIRSNAGCKQDCGVFQVHPAPRFQVPPPATPGIETVASVLNIEDDLVFNCLVDQARIDQRALAYDKESSERELLLDQNGRKSIRGNIKEVFYLPNGDQWTVKNGSLAVFSNGSKLRQSLGVDKTGAIELAEKELVQLQTELRQKQQDEARLDHEHTQYQRQWNQTKKAMQENDTRIADLTTKMDDIRNEIESTANTTIDTSEYEEDVMHVEKAMEGLLDKESRLQEQIAEAQPQIDAIRTKLVECVMRNDKILVDLKAAESELTQFLHTQSQKKEQLERKRQKAEKYREALKVHESKVLTLQENLQDCFEKARNATYHFQVREKLSQEGECSNGTQQTGLAEPTEMELEAIEPMEVDKDARQIEARIKTTKEKIKKERQRRNLDQEDADAAHEKYVKAKKDLEGRIIQVDELQRQITEILSDLKTRKKKWRRFLEHLKNKTAIKFGEILGYNKYSGRLSFDDDQRILDLEVQKNSQTTDSRSNDVKGLSGGERSYTTICLLLAFGESLETPFRILDEFDVFLDPQVRKLTINLLVHLAKQMEHRQFIFITPQDLTSVTPDDRLKILKLNPPTRRATAGGLEQQTLEFGSQ